MVLNDNNLKNNFCFLNNINKFLFINGLYVTENEIGIILEYIGFYFSDNYQCNQQNINGLSTSMENMFNKFVCLFSKQLIEMQCYTTHDFYLELQKVLKKSSGIIIWVNDFYLKYSDNYNKMINFRPIVILNIIGDKLTIFDNEEMTVNFEEIVVAACKNNIYEYITNAKDCSLKFKTDKQELITNGLKSISKMLLNNDQVDNFTVNGIYAMKNFRKHIENCDCSGELNNYFYQISRPGGVIETRKILTEFVRINYHEKNHHEILKLYMKISELWTIIANLFFKASKIYNDNVLLRILKNMDHVIELEIQGAISLQNLY